MLLRAAEDLVDVPRFTLDPPIPKAALLLGGTGLGSENWMVDRLIRLLSGSAIRPRQA